MFRNFDIFVKLGFIDFPHSFTAKLIEKGFKSYIRGIFVDLFRYTVKNDENFTLL
jgi:hypothetical protein